MRLYTIVFVRGDGSESNPVDSPSHWRWIKRSDAQEKADAINATFPKGVPEFYRVRVMK